MWASSTHTERKEIELLDARAPHVCAQKRHYLEDRERGLDSSHRLEDHASHEVRVHVGRGATVLEVTLAFSLGVTANAHRAATVHARDETNRNEHFVALVAHGNR